LTATEAFFVSRSMRALEILAFGPSTASQIATELQVHPRTARRLLNRMVSDGWLTRRGGPRPTYAPTLRIVALAAQHAHRAPLVRHATELLRGLHGQTGAEAHLVVPSYRSTLRLLWAGGDDAVELRDLAPAQATAGGKLLLAFRRPWRDVVLAGPLFALTERTLVDPVRLREELDLTSDRGRAVEDEEYRAGVRAVALPVRGADEEVVAALAISSRRLPFDALLAQESDVAAVAEELGSRLLVDSA
jgi:IclR family transcriptional regulator, acetate operon repressor